jgi:hypothetical protein
MESRSITFESSWMYVFKFWTLLQSSWNEFTLSNVVEQDSLHISARPNFCGCLLSLNKRWEKTCVTFSVICAIVATPSAFETHQFAPLCDFGVSCNKYRQSHVDSSRTFRSSSRASIPAACCHLHLRYCWYPPYCFQTFCSSSRDLELIQNMPWHRNPAVYDFIQW